LRQPYRLARKFRAVKPPKLSNFIKIRNSESRTAVQNIHLSEKHAKKGVPFNHFCESGI
jgi:hypothetical protein